MKTQFDFSGVDVHVDTNIGKHLSSLGHTLTTLTGEYEEEGTTTAEDGSSASDDLDDLDLSSSDDLNVLKRQKTQQIDLDLPPFLFDPNLDKALVAKYLEHEINEQAKTLEDLQKLVRFETRTFDLNHEFVTMTAGSIGRHGQRRDEEAQRAAEHRLQELQTGMIWSC